MPDTCVFLLLYTLHEPGGRGGGEGCGSQFCFMDLLEDSHM